MYNINFDIFRYESYITTKEFINKELDFPSVTICNLQSLRNSSAEILYREMQIYQTEGIEALLNATDGNPLIKQNMYNFSELTSLSAKELFQYCDWHGKSFDCSTRIRGLLTTKRCFTVNPRDVSLPKLIVKSPGEDFGMTVLIDVHQEENTYVEDVDFEAGIQLIAHHPDTFPMASERGIVLGPGWSHHLALTYKRIQRLSLPYAADECVSTSEDPTYNYEECIMNCSLRLHFSCGCDLATCSYLTLNENCYKRDITDIFADKCAYCKRNCNEHIYEVQTSSTLFPAKRMVGALKAITKINRTTEEEIKENMMQLKIYFSSMNHERIKHKPTFNLATLVANIGGCMGLFVGASVITLFEIVELLLFCCRRMFICLSERSR